MAFISYRDKPIMARKLSASARQKIAATQRQIVLEEGVRGTDSESQEIVAILYARARLAMGLAEIDYDKHFQ